jgi:hypothetical protein
MRGMLNRALRAQSTLELEGLSMEQAERLLAAIWCVLEAHALASPTMEVRSAAGLIDISLSFGSAEDCSIVSACWRSAWRTQREARFPSHRRRETNFAPQIPNRMRVPSSEATNGAEPTPTESKPAIQPQASEVDAILPGPIATSPGESSSPSMPPPDRASRGCRFITGDPKDFHALGEAIYCGSPVERVGESWCAEHRKICYMRSREGGLNTMHNAA